MLLHNRPDIHVSYAVNNSYVPSTYKDKDTGTQLLLPV